MRCSPLSSAVFLAALLLACPQSLLRAQEPLTERLDIKAMLAGGQAAASASPYDIGTIEAVFDLSTATLLRSASVNPCFVQVTFSEPQTLYSFRALFSHAASYRWKVESADTQADMDAHTGSWRELVPWTGAGDMVFSSGAPAAPRAARIVRLIAERLAGDDYVHLNEWEIHGAITLLDISVAPSSLSLLQGQTGKLTATGGTATGASLDLSTRVQWVSSNPDTAPVDSSGRVTAQSPGQADVTASLGGLSDTASVAVNPEPCDLDVLFIERSPRYDYDAPKNRPAPGDPVVFTAHVRNWGNGDLASAGYEWRVDGEVVQSGSIAGFAASTTREMQLGWLWQDGAHTVTFTTDPAGLIAEASEANNSRTDRTDALAVGFWVERSLYDYFHAFQRNLNAGSNSWEDWAGRQMAWQNELYASAVYPGSPSGVLDRVRVDRIIVVDDGALPLAGGLASNTPDLRDKTVDLMWGFPSSLLDGAFYANTTYASVANPFYKEPSLLHELGHARYLIDSYGFDVHNTYKPATGQGHDSVQILENGAPVAGTSLMPFLAFNEVLYYNKSGGVMTGPYGFVWSPYEAGALNQIAGHRALCGNYNAPCNIGAYLQDLPRQNVLRLKDPAGFPLRGAEVRVYRAGPGPGWYGKTFDNTPDLTLTTDSLGRALLGRNPFSSSYIVHTYGHANGVAILRIEHQGGVWYRFLEVSDFNLRFWAGETEEAFHDLSLPGAIGCCETIGEALLQPDGTDVRLQAKPVTASFGASKYISETDRSAGIRVITGQQMGEGDRFTVTGQMATAGGSREIAARSVLSASPADPLPPLMMRGSAVGGGPRGEHTPGVSGGVGLGSAGLLVSVWGTVLSTGADEFFLSDGSTPGGLKIRAPGLALPAAGQLARVTGIASIEEVSGSLRPVVITRRQSDIW
jgi:hypothetical protein